MFRFVLSKKKLTLLLGLILIIDSLSITGYNQYRKIKDIKKHNQIIERDFYNGNTNKYDNLKYIIIPSLDLKRIIVDDATKDSLDKYYVGLINGDINNNDGNIILAGHNISNVFSKLHQIKIGTIIILKHNQINEYIVINIYETLKNDTSVLETVNNQKTLTLITCTDNPDKRLIVRAIRK